MQIPDTCSLEELFSTVCQDAEVCSAYENTNGVSVKCSKDANSDTVDVVDLLCDVGLIVKDFSCQYIRFVVPSTNTEVPPTKWPRTVVDALMSASRSTSSLPKDKSPPKNKKQQLFNDVGQVLGVGFSPTVVESEGFDVVNTLTNALWSIDANHDTLNTATSNKGKGKVSQLPEIWNKLQGYNDYKAKKDV